MIEKSTNKMIGGSNKPEIKNKVVEEYHFAGGMEYKPITIEAESREEAEKIYKVKREKVA
jgi:hypothetical protein